MDQDKKPVKKKTKPNYFEQLMGGAGGRPAKNAVAGSSRSLSANATVTHSVIKAYRCML